MFFLNRHTARHRVAVVCWTILAVATLGSVCADESLSAPDTVDYRYFALDAWYGAIGLPDDCFKAAVDASGRFCTEFGKFQTHQGSYPNPPAQNPVWLEADLAGGADRTQQRMHSPRAPIAITHKRQKGVEVTEYLFASRPLDWSADIKGSALQTRSSGPDQREYLLMVEYENRDSSVAELTPLLHVHGNAIAAELDSSRTAFSVATNTRCVVSRDIVSMNAAATHEASLTLQPITLSPGATANWVLAIRRNGMAGEAPVTWREAEVLRQQAVDYWENGAGLPWDVIQVPDPQIGALLDTSIRELYQMRYVIDGLPAYFFGIANYNDYWILDGSFVTEAMDMLGRVDDASGYADYLLVHQQNDGRIQCMQDHWKETGIALVTLVRHAQLTQDKEWLKNRWPQFTRAVDAIKHMRRSGDSANPSALNYGLSPVGFGDGGIGREAEYTNNYWLLAGMKAAVEAAQWLGKSEEAATWAEEHRDFEQVFRRAIQRDAKTDRLGNRYIPAVMGPAIPQFPTRGQWAFCQGVYPGRIFAKDDPLMLGTLRMLQTYEAQGGIVEDSGWIGIWAQCGSFYGHDWLWLGDGRKASQLLYSFANHASPLHNWREEMPRQTQPGQKFSYAQGNGDMPHVSAAAEFIRLTGHLLAFDRDDELHLFEGMPETWWKAGMTTRLNGLRTPFGPLTMALQVAPDGKTASLRIDPLSDPSCSRIVVHWGNWTSSGTRATRVLAPDQRHELSLNLAGDP